MWQRAKASIRKATRHAHEKGKELKSETSQTQLRAIGPLAFHQQRPAFSNQTCTEGELGIQLVCERDLVPGPVQV